MLWGDQVKVFFHPMVLWDTRGIYAKGNMENISPTILINIYWIPGKIDHAYIDADFSLDQIKRYTDIFKEFCDIFAWSY